LLARLFAEVIEDMNMGSVAALTVNRAKRLQIFAHAFGSYKRARRNAPASRAVSALCCPSAAWQC
jgi:hypothetical protein